MTSLMACSLTCHGYASTYSCNGIFYWFLLNIALFCNKAKTQFHRESKMIVQCLFWYRIQISPSSASPILKRQLQEPSSVSIYAVDQIQWDWVHMVSGEFPRNLKDLSNMALLDYSWNFSWKQFKVWLNVDKTAVPQLPWIGSSYIDPTWIQ